MPSEVEDPGGDGLRKWRCLDAAGNSLWWQSPGRGWAETLFAAPRHRPKQAQPGAGPAATARSRAAEKAGRFGGESCDPLGLHALELT